MLLDRVDFNSLNLAQPSCQARIRSVLLIFLLLLLLLSLEMDDERSCREEFPQSWMARPSEESNKDFGFSHSGKDVSA